jgi:hypothetical protein
LNDTGLRTDLEKATKTRLAVAAAILF